MNSGDSTDWSTLIPALVLGVVAIAAVLLLLRPILSALIEKLTGRQASTKKNATTGWTFSLSGIKGRLALKGIERESGSLGAHLQSGDFANAERSLRAIVELVCTMPTISPESAMAQLLGALSHLMVVAERHQIHLENLELLEELIQDRGALLRGVIEAERSRRAFKRRKTEQGKDTPEWALIELKKQFELLRDQLNTNRANLHEQFQEALQFIVRARSRISMTVH